MKAIITRGIFCSILILLGATISWQLAAALHSPWLALATWSAGMAILCTAAAILLKRSPMGQITWRNRVVPFFLPWGFRIGKGSLQSITVNAWVIWVLIGAASITLFTWPRGSTATVHPIRAILLFTSWMILGALILRQLGLIKTFGSAHGRRALIKSVLMCVTLIVGGLTLWLLGYPTYAVLLSGGPIAAVGGSYGLFLAVMMTAGRNARWN